MMIEIRHRIVVKNVVPASSLGIAIIGLILELYGFYGCIFCWASRVILCLIALSTFLERRYHYLRYVSALMFFMGFVTGLTQLRFLMQSAAGGTSCVLWVPELLPDAWVPFWMSFPACDYSGVLGVPWGVWLLMYLSAAVVVWLFSRRENVKFF